MLQYPKQKKTGPNRSEFVTLQVYQVHPDSDEPDVLLSTFSNMVRHTKWQKLKLPTTALQPLMDNPDTDAPRTLQLRIDCATCKKDVLWPVMVKKGGGGGSAGSEKRHNKRASSRGSSGSKDKRRVSKRSQRRRKKRRNEEKVAKRRPFIVVIAQGRGLSSAAQKEGGRVSRRRGKRQSGKCESRPGNCSKKPLYISFKELGWDSWILKPEGFQANYCEGSCPNVAPQSQRHTPIWQHFQRNTDYNQCCTPKKMRPLSLLYLTEDGNIIKTSLANMIVEKCGCA